jgi:hypothetical protein
MCLVFEWSVFFNFNTEKIHGNQYKVLGGGVAEFVNTSVVCPQGRGSKLGGS